MTRTLGTSLLRGCVIFIWVLWGTQWFASAMEVTRSLQAFNTITEWPGAPDIALSRYIAGFIGAAISLALLAGYLSPVAGILGAVLTVLASGWSTVVLLTMTWGAATYFPASLFLCVAVMGILLSDLKQWRAPTSWATS
jgi:uncharacterized membrane protein YkgB